MAQDSHKNLEHFTVIRGGLYASRSPFCAMERARLKVQEHASRLMQRRARGQAIRDRAIQNVAAGVTNPLGEPVKLLHRYRWAGVPFEEAWQAVVVPIMAEARLAYDEQHDDDRAA